MTLRKEIWNQASLRRTKIATRQLIKRSFKVLFSFNAVPSQTIQIICQKCQMRVKRVWVDSTLAKDKRPHSVRSKSCFNRLLRTLKVICRFYLIWQKLIFFSMSFISGKNRWSLFLKGRLWLLINIFRCHR